MVELPNGKEIVVREERRRVLASGRGALDVDYVTNLPRADVIALAHEVQDVWSHYRNAADQEGLGQVIITAYDDRMEGDGTGFGFLRDPDGDWKGPEVLTLPSGKRVVIIRAYEKSFPDGLVFFVDYVTDLPFRPRCGLLAEVEEVWAEFRERAEAVKAPKAIIAANVDPIGGHLMTFGFTRTADGEWHSPAC